MQDLRLVALDTETTGLHVSNGDRIIEIGLVELCNGRITGREFQAYINPEHEVAIDAYQIHGISNEFLKDKPKFSEVSDQLLEFMDGATLIIHNAPFDVRFLNRELSSLNKPLLELSQVIDTLVIARSQFPGQRVSLDALCSKFKIDDSMRDFHGALLDAKLLAQVYVAMTQSLQQFSFSFEERVRKDAAALDYQFSQCMQFKTQIPNTKEFKKHQNFLAKITNPIWRR